MAEDRTGLVGRFCFRLGEGHDAEQRGEDDRDNQESTSAYETTAKIEKVYSAAELLANPIGIKPATVTNEPVSIGIANVLYANVAASSLPSSAARRGSSRRRWSLRHRQAIRAR